MKTISNWAFWCVGYIKYLRTGLSRHLFYISSAAVTSGRQVYGSWCAALVPPVVQMPCYFRCNLMVQQLD